MDDLTLMKSFRAERVVDDVKAREEIWRVLEPRFDAAPAAPAPIATPARPRRHLLGPRRLLALGGAAAAVAAAVLVFNSGASNTPNAFAKAFTVQRQSGGGVAIKIYSAEDAAGLERALGKAGIRSQVTWLPHGTRCREPRFTPSTAKTSRGGTIGGVATMSGPGQAMTIGVMSPQQWRERWRGHTHAEVSKLTPKISLDPGSFRPDQTVVISGSPVPFHGDPKGGYKAHFGIAEGPVKPCEPVRAPNRLHPSKSREMKSGQGQDHHAATATRKSGSNPSAPQEGHRSAIPVKKQGGGGVATKPISAEDAAGLERALAKAGIRSQVTWLAAGMMCRGHRFQFSAAKTSQGNKINGLTWMSGPGEATTFGAMGPRQWGERWRDKTPTAQISLEPESFRPDQTVIIFGSRVPNEKGNPEGDFKVYYAIAEGPVKPCEPVKPPAEAPEGEGK